MYRKACLHCSARKVYNYLKVKVSNFLKFQEGLTLPLVFSYAADARGMVDSSNEELMKKLQRWRDMADSTDMRKEK